MKINYNCLRKLLIVLESNLQFSEDLEYPDLSFKDVCDLMPEFTREDIAYSTIMAEESNLIKAHIISAENSFYECVYFGLTYKGHQFLENVKNNAVWEKTKSITKRVGSMSLDVISSIASELLKGLITSQLQ